MLTRLSIKNYALIEDLEIELGKGLTILTGETGAGKSIILGAVSLLTGNRADLSLVKSDKRKCIIEAEFRTEGLNLEEVFKKHDLDFEKHTVIRREFSKDGKSRAFVNDTPAVLLQLKDIVNRLLDVHSQHENLELNSKKYQLDALDAYAGSMEIRSDYSLKFSAYKESVENLELLQSRVERMRENTDYMTHQFQELDSAKLETGELEQLEAELESLNHSEDIIQNLSALDQILNQSEGGPYDQLLQVAQLLRKTKQFLPDIQDLADRLESQLIELDDIRSEIASRSESSIFDPERMQLVQDRVSLIYQLQQKHRVSDVTGLIELRDNLEEELRTIHNFDDVLAETQLKVEQTRKALKAVADLLTKKRSEASGHLEKSITERLQRLGMVNSRFNIEVRPKLEFGSDGNDDVEFLFTANKGQAPKPIGKVASGGELSRVMLSIKATMAEKTQLPTIVFDEIDTGISGEIANKMGKIIREMSATTQVLAISHLPQVAAQGIHHFKVYKDESGEVSETRIKPLVGEEQVMEIARMLSGEEVTPEAINNAKVLLTSV